MRSLPYHPSIASHAQHDEAIHPSKPPKTRPNFSLTPDQNVTITNAMSGEPMSTRLNHIVMYLVQSLGDHARRVNMPHSLCQLLTNRLIRLTHRLRTLIERGPLPPRPPRTTPRNPPKNTAPTHEYYPPTNFAWLLRLFPNSGVAVAHFQLKTLLDEPEAQSLIATHPTLARSIRPLCRMVGLKTPTCLKLPRKPRTKRAPPPTPQPPKPARKIWHPAPPPRPMTPAEAQLAARQFFNPREFYL